MPLQFTNCRLGPNKLNQLVEWQDVVRWRQGTNFTEVVKEEPGTGKFPLRVTVGLKFINGDTLAR